MLEPCFSGTWESPGPGRQGPCVTFDLRAIHGVGELATPAPRMPSFIWGTDVGVLESESDCSPDLQSLVFCYSDTPCPVHCQCTCPGPYTDVADGISGFMSLWWGYFARPQGKRTCIVQMLLDELGRFGGSYSSFLRNRGGGGERMGLGEEERTGIRM